MQGMLPAGFCKISTLFCRFQQQGDFFDRACQAIFFTADRDAGGSVILESFSQFASGACRHGRQKQKRAWQALTK
jgi:hypothetical protein